MGEQLWSTQTEKVKRFQKERWTKQVRRNESNKDGLLHGSGHTNAGRANAYGRIPITAKYAATCQAVRLGKECGNEIAKGARTYWEPESRRIECRECWM